MIPEVIEQRLKDINNEIHSLDSLKDSYDDVNVHIVEDQINLLLTEKQSLTELLENCFDNMIGL
jgi:hypothetical protein